MSPVDTDPRRQSDRTGFGECGEARGDLRGSGAGALHKTRPQTGEIGLAGIELTPYQVRPRLRRHSQTQRLQAGLLTSGAVYHAPSQSIIGSVAGTPGRGPCGQSILTGFPVRPVTVARPWRIFTAFPILCKTRSGTSVRRSPSSTKMEPLCRSSEYNLETAESQILNVHAGHRGWFRLRAPFAATFGDVEDESRQQQARRQFHHVGLSSQLSLPFSLPSNIK